MKAGLHERTWWFYFATSTAMVLAVGTWSPEHRDAALSLAALHGGFGLALTVAVARARTAAALAVVRGVFSTIAMPVVFSALAWALPAVHPEPYEYVWIAADRALFGVDPTVWLGRRLGPWPVELLQWCYAAFYLIPITAVLAAARKSGAAAYTRSLELVVLGFVLSYLGYFLWPTLPPSRFLVHDVPIQGVWLADRLHAAIDAAEVHRWNCFPSGHTMLSVLSLALVWRYARTVFWWLAPVVVGLVFSTVALRYHYVADVLAGLLGTALTFAIGAGLVALDGESAPA